MKKLVSLVLALFAASASAQVNNRGVIVKDEGSQLGLARTVDFVGSSVSCGISGGQATCTFSAPTATITSGSTATSLCSAGGVVYSISNLAKCDGNLTFDNNTLTLGNVTTVGRSTLTLKDTVSGTSSDSNFFRIAGMLTANNTSEANAAKLQITTSASDVTGSVGRYGFRVELRPETAGSGKNANANAAIIGMSAAESTGTLLTRASIGFQGQAIGNTASGTTLLFGAIGSTVGQASIGNVGIWGHTGQGTAPINGIGVFGDASAYTGVGIGGFFKLGASVENVWPNIATSAAIAGTNHTKAADLLFLSDNYSAAPAGAASKTFRVVDGAQAQCGNCVLTSGTMTPENQGEIRSVSHSYSWSNAQIVALGAVTSGDITAFTLPAKHVVENVYVIITGQGAGTTTLTVSCGRTSASYIDYIVASDAKAAANTVYGDASAERGTNLTGYDLPSYTGTTSIVCNFVSTGANLSSVTGSTGRVVLISTLIP